MTTADRFWSHVDKSGGPDACWPWTAALDEQGYGYFTADRKGIRAGRFALQLKLGRQLARGEVTRHGDSCTTRACCNPVHLSPGTQADNIADRDRLGRTARGERQWKAKLTEDEVAEIKERLAAGEKQVHIAPDYGVCSMTISHIARGNNWKHVAPAIATAARVARGELTASTAIYAASRAP